MDIQIKVIFNYKDRTLVVIKFNSTQRSHYCAYTTTNLDISYTDGDNLSPESLIRCHGGITFGASKLQLENLPKEIKDKLFFGIDFAHLGDDNWELADVMNEAKRLADGVIAYEKIYPEILARESNIKKKYDEVLNGSNN